MGVIEDLRGRMRWTYRRARYVAQTEGTRTLVRRAAAMAGLGARDAVHPQQILQPLASPLVESGWPLSVLLISGTGPRAATLVHLDAPVLPGEPGDLAAQQVVSVLYVQGRANWPSPAVLAEAHRLRQRVVLELLTADSAEGLPECDLVVTAAVRDLATPVPVHVIGNGSPPLSGLLQQVKA